MYSVVCNDVQLVAHIALSTLFEQKVLVLQSATSKTPSTKKNQKKTRTKKTKKNKRLQKTIWIPSMRTDT